MFTTLSLSPRPVSKPFDFRFIPIDIAHFQKRPIRRRHKRMGGPASQHLATPGLTCSTHTSTQTNSPPAQEESPGTRVPVPRPQVTSSTVFQLCPAVNHAPTPSPHFLDDCGHVEALRNRTQPSAMPQHDANPLPLPQIPSPTGSKCSASPITNQVPQCSATAEQEHANGLTSHALPAPIIAPYDGSISSGHTLPISHTPISAWNIEVHRGSADWDSRCPPGPVSVTPDIAHVERAPLSTLVSVKRRSNPIVLIRLSRTILKDYAQALDCREGRDLIDDPPQMHGYEDDKGRRRLRMRAPGMLPWVSRGTKKGSRYAEPTHSSPSRITVTGPRRRSLAPSAACTDGHKAIGKVWSERHDNRLLRLRGENELPWRRIAGAYFGGTNLAWLQRRYMALTVGALPQGRPPFGAGVRRSRRIDHDA